MRNPAPALLLAVPSFRCLNTACGAEQAAASWVPAARARGVKPLAHVAPRLPRQEEGKTPWSLSRVWQPRGHCRDRGAAVGGHRIAAAALGVPCRQLEGTPAVVGRGDFWVSSVSKSRLSI